MELWSYFAIGAMCVVAFVLWVSYNTLQVYAQRVREGASNITVSLRMRTDLASQLFKLIGEYGVHENLYRTRFLGHKFGLRGLS